jgi:hypothetical protein
MLQVFAVEGAGASAECYRKNQTIIKAKSITLGYSDALHMGGLVNGQNLGHGSPQAIEGWPQFRPWTLMLALRDVREFVQHLDTHEVRAI